MLKGQKCFCCAWIVKKKGVSKDGSLQQNRHGYILINETQNTDSVKYGNEEEMNKYELL